MNFFILLFYLNLVSFGEKYGPLGKNSNSLEILETSIDNTNYCGVGQKTESRQDCINWVNYTKQKHKQIRIFEQTTICAYNNLRYYCPTQKYEYGSYFYDWDFCANTTCPHPAEQYPYKVSSKASASFLRLDLSILRFNYFLIVSSFHKEYLVIFKVCQNCDLESAEIMRQFRKYEKKLEAIENQEYFCLVNLSQNTKYNFIILPISNPGVIGHVRQFSLSTRIAKPDTPSFVRAIDRGPSEITLMWNIPGETDSFGLPSQYVIRQHEPRDSKEISTENNYCRISHLYSCTKYCFTVAARNTVGESEESNPSCFYMNPVFNNISIAPISPEQSTFVTRIQWEYKNADNCVVKFIVEYHIKQFPHATRNITTEKQYVELSNLEPLKTYVVNVRPEIDGEAGPFSDAIEFRTRHKSTSGIPFILIFFVILLFILFGSLYYKRDRLLLLIRKHRSSGRNSKVGVESLKVKHVTEKNLFISEEEKKPFTNEIKKAQNTKLFLGTNRYVNIYQKEFQIDKEKSNLIKEFKDVLLIAESYEKKNNLTTNVGALLENRTKNRFANILPFDQTRIVLRGKQPGNDYINANRIPFPENTNKIEYIACQGPPDECVPDFWMMIWEQKVSVIVMLTRIYEDDKKKCSQYWPTELYKTETIGKTSNILISMEKESTNDAFDERKFKVINKEANEERFVVHLQMHSWLDYSAPNAEDFELFLFRFHEITAESNSTPFLVHCSAGVGRTGTFIVLDRIIRKVVDGMKYIDVFKEVLELRKYRKFMVQRQAQYIFIHEFIKHFLVKYLQIENDDEGNIYANSK